MKLGETFTLSFSEFIGKDVVISDEGEYYDGELVGNRFYYGKFKGSDYKQDGIYFRIDSNLIKISTTTKITFKDK